MRASGYLYASAAVLGVASGIYSYENRPVTWGVHVGETRTVPDGHFAMDRVDRQVCALPPGARLVVKGTEPTYGVFVEIAALPPSSRNECSPGDQGFVKAERGTGPYVSAWPSEGP